MNKVHYRSVFPVSSTALFAWHERPGAFARLAPPWQSMRVVASPERLENGSTATLEIKQGPLTKRWVSEHFDVRPGERFSDRQLEGPFGAWTHTHRCEALSAESSALSDEIDYALPLARVTEGLAGRWASGQLDRLFAYRHAVLQSDFQHYGSDQPGKGKTVLVTGSTGLIGSRLVPLLQTLGFTVRGLSRHPRGEADFRWDYAAGSIDPEALEGLHGVVHLAGENIAGGRWTEERRQRILESREQGTQLIAERLAALVAKPTVLVSASGVNFYAADGTPCTEEAPRGDGFLSEVCARWEAAAEPAGRAGVRVVHPRFGVVLSPEGGALAKLLPAFLAGGGGPIGSGRQRFPWISIEDVLGIIVTALLDENLEGPLNAVGPETVSQREFATVLGQVLRRPSVVPLPARAVRAIFGKMGEETILADVQPIPAVLTRQAYHWRQPTLEGALRQVLGRLRPEDIPKVKEA